MFARMFARINFQGIEMIEFVKSPEDTPETEYPRFREWNINAETDKGGFPLTKKGFFLIGN